MSFALSNSLPAGRYDCHMHALRGKASPASLAAELAAAGIAGGAVFSENPDPAGDGVPAPPPPAECIGNVLGWTSVSPVLFPFYWIDPVADGAEELVELAVSRGIMGFKVLPGTFMPGDERAMPVYRRIAAAGKPVMFHSGILWDGRYSSRYTRPGNYEALLAVKGLRFALAHISWPWIDECIAVFGKLLNARGMWGDDTPEMFIDITPGTPPAYRREALTKLFTVGYDVRDHVLFGTDAELGHYGVAWSKTWQETDDAVYRDLGLGEEDIDGVYRGAFRRFLFGAGAGAAARRIPGQAAFA